MPFNRKHISGIWYGHRLDLFFLFSSHRLHSFNQHMWESFAGKESLAGIEGNCETPSYYLRQSCTMPSYNYPKVLAVYCKYSVSGQDKKIWNGGRHLEL